MWTIKLHGIVLHQLEIRQKVLNTSVFIAISLVFHLFEANWVGDIVVVVRSNPSLNRVSKPLIVLILVKKHLYNLFDQIVEHGNTGLFGSS
jgi:hypothetical protein